MLRGIIFDMDGVLVDSERYICEAAMRMFQEEHNLTVKPEDFLPFVGSGENRYVGGVAETYGLKIDVEKDKIRTYNIYGEIVHGKLEPLSGAREFIVKAKSRGLKLAVASSADRMKVDINLRESGLSPELFDAIVSGQDVTHKKPDPEIFLLAAQRIGISPSEGVVVEDAVNGVVAAKVGGFKCLGLTTTFSPEELSQADWVAPTLEEVPDEVLEW